MITRCVWCNSIRNDTGGWQSVADAGDPGKKSLFTHTMCLTCLKNADPDLHKMVSAILEEEQAGQKGETKKF